jgi:hypothetical protein
MFLRVLIGSHFVSLGMLIVHDDCDHVVLELFCRVVYDRPCDVEVLEVFPPNYVDRRIQEIAEKLSKSRFLGLEE